MAFAKNAAITAGFVGAFGLGVWTGPHLMNRTTTDTVAAVEPAPVVPEASPMPTATSGRVRPAAAAPRAADGTAAFAPVTTSVVTRTPELHQRLKPLLNKGANMDVAAEGFNSAEQFATVVHASQNTEVPFMLLKHRVLNEGDTLVAAIRKSKPDLDAVIEADRARAEARSDIASLN